ncbi:hypothetical protein FPZ54_13260 [Sphingomonas suaedae]|uniref:Uncharacterized protein n=1 Tax=Sphingomonas suaedae TaxID=2599297 RepID=A0A518RHI9_9SPHN|nr:hypothetical protein [Sphingomonas suaedae]QDX26879.1 hypothetical protein FPZ54_13260 [Sphingomonas suaedae]
MAALLNDYANEIRPNIFQAISVKDVENFSTHRVKGSTRLGFYAQVALFLLQRDERREFDIPAYEWLIPECERNLGLQIATYFSPVGSMKRRANSKRRSQLGRLQSVRLPDESSAKTASHPASKPAPSNRPARTRFSSLLSHRKTVRRPRAPTRHSTDDQDHAQ